MLDKKRRLYRLIEFYINDFNKEFLEEGYGKGTKITIHSMSHSPTNNCILFEVIILLGEVICEDVIDREMADYLVQDALVYFFPDQSIKTMVRWDV